MIWCGTAERWDLLQLEKNGPSNGVEQLRQRIRAWCRVVEFAEEFGISVSYEPLVLRGPRGG